MIDFDHSERTMTLFGRGAPGATYARNPYPMLDRLRDTAPRYFCAERNAWFVSSHPDVTMLLRDDRLGIGKASSFSDQSADFRRSVVRQLRAWFAGRQPATADIVARVADRRVGQLVTGAEVDLVEDVAQAVPVGVMAELLGIADFDIPALRQLATSVLQSYDLDWDGCPTNFIGATAFFRAYFQRHWHAGPQTELMKLLHDARAEHSLPDDSMIDTCMKLFSAGTTTTAGCLANILARLVDPDRGPDTELDTAPSSEAVEELLRLTVPVLALKRLASEAIPFGDGIIAPGQTVYLLIASANRDPAVFPSDSLPDERRERHLSFGQGRYHCLGAPLARLELTSVLDRIMPLLGQIHLVAPVAWRDAWLIHEARCIQVKIEGAACAD